MGADREVRFQQAVAHAQASKCKPNCMVEADLHEADLREVGSHTGRVHSSV